MKNIILCGGSGTRLWPCSTEDYPKQFINLFGDESLLKNTYDRVKDLGDITLISNNNFTEIIKEQLKEKDYNLILEPCKRDTCAAITCSVLTYKDDDIILVLPSDHYIPDKNEFHETIKKGIKFAEEGHIVTYGVKPLYPETGYGYIEFQNNDVIKFREKPDLNTAKSFLEKGNFYWNSGIFLFKAKTFKDEMKKYNERILEDCQKSISNWENNILQFNENFKKIQSVSIDYILMEKTEKIKVIQCDFKWNDVGNWKAVSELKANDKNIILENSNCFFFSNSSKKKKKIVCIDVSDIALIETDDFLLITNLKSDSSKIKKLNL